MANSIFYKKDGRVKQPWAIPALYFNKKVKTLYHPDQGRDMLLIALIVEIIRLSIKIYRHDLAYDDLLSTGITAVVMLGLVIGVTKYILRINLKDVGLKGFSQWNAYEFVFPGVVAPLLFFILYSVSRDLFYSFLHENGSFYFLVSFVFYLSWGFYQELIYRGFLQTELTRRYGAPVAILLATLTYTLGPLHLYQLYQGKFLFIAITFVTGLTLGILYHRCYNIWIVGLLHGIGSWFLLGLT